MGSIFVIAGLFTTILASGGKFLFGNKTDNAHRSMLAITRHSFKKGDPTTLLSFAQLLGIAWIVCGVLLNVTDDILVGLSGPLLFFIELFFPLFVVYIIMIILARRKGQG